MSRKKDILHCYSERGICLYDTVEINGIMQYIQVRGENKSAPLLLFLHGGPGGSMAGLCHIMQSEWEKNFTVVNWDQRNTCKTYLANKNNAAAIAQTGSISDYMADIDAVIDYLHTIYDFEKIILAGFSWGSLIGAEYAKTHGDRVSHYIGIGQHIHYIDGLQYSCEWLKDAAKDSASDINKIQRFLDNIPQPPEMNATFLRSLQGFSMLGAKYIAKDGRPFPLKDLLTSPFLNLSEKMSMLRSDPKLFTGTYHTLMNHDFRKNLHFDMPVLFVSGDEDFVCPNQLLERCFDDISAPFKKIAVIPKATHLCFYDQPRVFLKEITEFINITM
ncbi:alpha/beta fold hydrolase [Ruminococcus flavefaciens]|uniref:Pimeloyl-ACP methyl ester carboxylesterase n=1 Tax=Ruminococcus flavefaciens TaxID=1265 RepID=A0A1M7K4G8_RUMFL|nr:alpha/beta hydrolase [Ruminococcus flavefaciens]SHM60071.1 Pimeloyl-ACP methyl ester carboxylesterase [Ruminococcus flavefaciens]